MNERPVPEDFYKRVLDGMLEGCQILSFDWKYLYLNATAETHNRRPNSELIGQHYAAMWPGIETTEVYRVIEDCLVRRIPRDLENEFEYPDGRKGWFELRISPIPEGVFIMSIDITSRKELEHSLRQNEDQLRQSQKMEAIGRLAAGVAHDFNNMLTVILGHVDLAQLNLENPGAISNHLSEVKRAAEGSAALTNQLLAFAHKQPVSPALLDINFIIEEKLSMIKSLLGHTIQCDWLPSTNLWRTKMDRIQFEQLLMNLCVNARDAIGRQGKVTIRTLNTRIDDEFVDQCPDARHGRFVQLLVSDTGCGFAQQELPRIFEPFYQPERMKPRHSLGLSIVYGIVKQNQGFIHITSQENAGTTFRIYLPSSPNADRKSAI